MCRVSVYQYALECIFHLYMKNPLLYNEKHPLILSYMDLALDTIAEINEEEYVI